MLSLLGLDDLFKFDPVFSHFRLSSHMVMKMSLSLIGISVTKPARISFTNPDWISFTEPDWISFTGPD